MDSRVSVSSMTRQPDQIARGETSGKEGTKTRAQNSDVYVLGLADELEKVRYPVPEDYMPFG